MRRILGITTALLIAACGGGEEAEVEAEAEAPAAEAPAAEAPAMAATLPEGVTEAMVQAGQAAFPTSVCGACHGPDGTGVPGVGPSLVDQTWLNMDGSYEAIVKVINEGVTQPKEAATPMPPKGGNAGMTEAQVNEIAAYLYARSHS